MEPDFYKMQARPVEELPMFATLPPDHRSPDHETSIAAAESVRPGGHALRRRILEILAQPMTDLELEALPEFGEFGPSTVRKRRSELMALGVVVETGEKRNGAKVWRRSYP